MKAAETKECAIDKNEVIANAYVLNCSIIMCIIMCSTLILNMLDIFIVEDKLMYIAVSGGAISTLIIAIIVKYFNNSPMTKYVLITLMVTYVTIIGIALTYHTLLVCTVPVLCSTQYKNKRFVYYTYIISVIGMFLIVMLGYFYGLCDANMLMLTSSTIENYIDSSTNTLTIDTINTNPWMTLPLYFVFPRALLLLALIPVILHIVDVISQNAVREMEYKKLSETDSMTQLFNKNKYLQMIEDYYPEIETVGVMFWDINGLKDVNDTYGHEYGDHLISAISSAIKENMGEYTYAYRIGGDEFVVIIENATEEMLVAISKKCKASIAIKNEVSKIPISASVGYAVGLGANIETLIAKADANMYKDKKKHYQEQIKE